MKQYLDLIKAIKEQGTYKPAAREGMPGTQSLFGYQNRYKLSEGFPLMTTKKISWKAVTSETLWFLRGDTNIKFLDEKNVKYMWHEDSYNYYVSIAKGNTGKEANDIYRKNEDGSLSMFTYKEYLEVIANTPREKLPHYRMSSDSIYTLGDCGYQYGKVWRKWKGDSWIEGNTDGTDGCYLWNNTVDQIQKVLDSLRQAPQGRRHIVTAVDPVHDEELALYWCHSMFQFNARPLTHYEKYERLSELRVDVISRDVEEFYKERGLPEYYLDCQLYQRSADTILGVPFNIASYSLITCLFAKICNMIPGDFVHTFGDVHLYDNHKEAIETQEKRTPTALPKLKFSSMLESSVLLLNSGALSLDEFFNIISQEDFILEGYNPQSKIEAGLSTGLKKN